MPLLERFEHSARGQRGNDVGGDGLAAANGIDPFVGLGLQMDLVGRNTESFGKRFAHFRKMRTELRPFGDYDGIDMFDGEVFIVEQLLGMLQEPEAVRYFPFRIGVREMRADVAKPRRAEKSVA